MNLVMYFKAMPRSGYNPKCQKLLLGSSSSLIYEDRNIPLASRSLMVTSPLLWEMGLLMGFLLLSEQGTLLFPSSGSHPWDTADPPKVTIRS